MLLAAVSDPWLARPTLGGNDHRRSRKQDRGAEDQEPHRVGTWYDVVREPEHLLNDLDVLVGRNERRRVKTASRLVKCATC